MKTFEIVMHEDRNVRLSGLLQEVGGEFAPVEKRPGVIVLPGGGYGICSDREADPVALEFARAGYQAFILRYTVSAVEKEKIWPHPLEDYDEAWEIIESHAEEWHVDMDRIAVCGFSAGGHLTACASTMAKHRPKAAILGYPAILPKTVALCGPNMPLPCEHVDSHTPPCFLFAARDDLLVSVKNATAFADALCDKGINYELHIYSYGNHGFSNGAAWVNATSLSPRVKNWISDAIGFLEEVWGEFTSAGFTKPKIGQMVNGDYGDCLSANCTVYFLQQQEAARPVIGDALNAIDAAIRARGYEGAAADYVKTIYTLRGLLEIVGIPAEKIDDLDDALGKVKAVR